MSKQRTNHKRIEFSRTYTEQSETTSPGQSDITTPNSSRKSTIENNEDMDQENFYHWGATREILKTMRRRNNSPETRRLVEQRNALSRPGTFSNPC